MEKIRNLLPKNLLTKVLEHKVSIGLGLALLLIIIVAGVFLTSILGNKPLGPLQEIELSFNAEGPYALLIPRRDGNAINLNIKRVGAYDEISYELTYQSEGVDRGVQGTIETKDKKSEYLQEILFGTCSRGDTTDPLHCVFDKDVENGTLLLRIRQKNIVYKMNTSWHLQKPDVALGVITSGDNHFQFKTSASREQLALIGFTLVNDLTGVPKLPDSKAVLGKVYALNIAQTKDFVPGELTVELAEDPPAEAVIAVFVEGDNEWQVLDTKVTGSKVTTNTDKAGIFAVLVPASE